MLTSIGLTEHLICDRMEVHEHKPVGGSIRMEGPYLPEGSGDEESPEYIGTRGIDKDAQVVYTKRMESFEALYEGQTPVGKKRRRSLHDYTVKNCEEASGGRWGQA